MSQLYPLWDSTNNTRCSSIFAVVPGTVCVLTATGLKSYRPATADTDGQREQFACIRRLLYDYDATTKRQRLSSCDWIFDMSDFTAEQVSDQLVSTCGLPWLLSCRRNIGIIGLPGSYQLELNDCDAVGVAQVYAEAYAAAAIPVQVAGLFYS